MAETQSLRGRLFARLVVPLVALLVVSAGLAYYASFRFANQVYDNWISDTAVALSQLTRRDPTGLSLHLPAEARHMLSSDQRDKTYYRVTDIEGGFIAGHRMLPAPAQIPEPDAAPVCNDASFDGLPIRVATYRPAALPIIVQVAETVVKRDMLAFEIIAGMLVPLLVLVALGAVSVWVGVDAGLSPLTRLAQLLRDRSPEDLGPLPESSAPREVRPLVHALNGLLARVDEMLSVQRRFVADAAHQLRTPIAGIKTQSEMALRTRDPAALPAVLQNIVAGSTRLSSLVTQLLSLARVESQRNTLPALQAVDLDRLTRAVTSDWIARALETGIDLGYEAPASPAVIRGDPVLLREMLANLIDNALKHCPSGSVATVSIEADDTGTVLAVEDDGPGIPEPDRERMFERFHRGADTTAAGTGLGLAIVREFAREQGATARIEPARSGRGTRVEVRFPPAGDGEEALV